MNKEQLELVNYLIKYVELAQSRGAYRIPESAELNAVFTKIGEVMKLKDVTEDNEKN